MGGKYVEKEIYIDFTYFLSQRHYEKWKEDSALKRLAKNRYETEQCLQEENEKLRTENMKLRAEIEYFQIENMKLQKQFLKLKNEQILMQKNRTVKNEKSKRKHYILKKGIDLYGKYRKDMITKIVFEEFLPEETIDAWDVSQLQNGSIKAWIDSESVLHIGSDGIICANSNSYDLFNRYTSVTDIDFGQFFDTSNVKNMGWMFSFCKSLEKLDLSNFKTGNATDMHGMFLWCKSLRVLNISNFDTREVTDMSFMFCGCSSLEVDIRKFDMRNVTSKESMLTGCRKAIQ